MLKVGRIQDEDRRTGRARYRLFQRRRCDPSRIIGREWLDRPAAQAEKARRAIDRAMSFLTRQNGQTRRAEESVLLHVPFAALQQRMARSGEAGRMRELTAGREGEGGFARQIQQFLDPCAGYVLDDRGGRAAGVERRILVPCRDQPIRGQCGLHAAADDPGEKAAASAAVHSVAGMTRQPFDDFFRSGSELRQRSAEDRGEVVARRARRCRPLVEAIDPRGGGAVGAVQSFAHSFRSLVSVSVRSRA